MDNVDHIFCINLDHRTDRWGQIQRQAEILELDIERVPGVIVDPEDPRAKGWRPHRLPKLGCRLSFEKCFLLAVKRKYETIMILEDDCLFHKNFHKILERSFREIRDRRLPWDILHSGNRSWGKKMIGGSCYSNLYIIRSHVSNVCSIYNLVENSHKMMTLLDPIYPGYKRMGTDDLFSQLNYKGEIKILTPGGPPFAIQAPGYSDIARRYRNNSRVPNLRAYLCGDQYGLE